MTLLERYMKVIEWLHKNLLVNCENAERITGDEQMELKLIEESERNIQLIKNQSEKVQLAAINE